MAVRTMIDWATLATMDTGAIMDWIKAQGLEGSVRPTAKGWRVKVESTSYTPFGSAEYFTVAAESVTMSDAVLRVAYVVHAAMTVNVELAPKEEKRGKKS